MNSNSKLFPRFLLFVIATFALLALPSLFGPAALMQQSGGPYILNPSVISGGGGSSSNGNTSVTGTIGQSTLGTSSGGVFSVNAGFWQAASPCAAPAVSLQPSNQAVCAGATGTSPSFQWRKNTINLSNTGNISGATSATLTINPAAPGDAASYDVVITGACGNATSNAAALTVNGYSLSSMSQSFPGSGGPSSVNVIVAGSCPWAAVSNATWITERSTTR